MLLNMGRILKQISLCFPDRAALINIERRREFTYRQMNALSNRVCNFLEYKFGLAEGDFFATLLENDNMGFFHPWMLKSAAAAVWIDVRESLTQKLKQIDTVQPRLVFIETASLAQLYEPLRERSISIVCMDPPQEALPDVYDFWKLADAASDTRISPELVADDTSRHISVLRFTGGTTGHAKCAMYSLANLWFWGCNPAHYYETLPFEHPRAMFSSPVNHAASGSVVIPVIIKGGTVVTLNKADIEHMGRVISEQKINLIYAVPTVLYRMLAMDLPQKFDLSSLKTIRYGAASISPSKLEGLLEEFGKIFVQGYGSTECWPSCTILPRKDHGTTTAEQIERLSSVGRPMPGEEVLICDEDGCELTTGQEGEIWVRGANTIQGYFKSPETTQQNFSPNGFWKSGDVGRMDEKGYLFLIDRLKDMIITGGYNVYANEVENCLNSHPAVENSAVVGVPDEIWGEAVYAVVILRQGVRATAEQLIAHCKQHLARYKAPKQIEFTAQLPLSPAGKVLRRKIKKRLGITNPRLSYLK